jgi:DNA-binding CsgD family transcriptional regulator
MNDSVNRERRLLEIIEMIYSADDDGEMVSAVFPALRGVMPFSSGVLMPVDPDTLELRAGWCFDCSTADMASYLAHYAPLDPYVAQQPGPALLNCSVRFSDIVRRSDLERSEFCDFLRGVPYYHALGILAGVAGQAVAAFSVHRQRDERDFSADERQIVDHIGPHLARAIILRRQANGAARHEETGLLVVRAPAEALHLNATACRLLGPTPPATLLGALPPAGTGVIRLAGQCYRVSRVPWAAASLLRRFAVADAANDPPNHRLADADPLHRWATHARDGGQSMIIALQPFRQRTDLIRRLAQHGLSPRQAQVTVGALRGLANGEIARELCIGVQTVKDHLQAIYSQLGVHSRADLLSRLLGTTGAPPAPDPRRG